MSDRSLRARRVVGIGLLASGLLLPGLLLTHATRSAAESKPAKPQKKATPKEQKGEAKGAPTPGSERCVHVVRAGDTVSRVAVRSGVTRQSIVSTNHLANPDRLRVGQRLMLAGCGASRRAAARDPEIAGEPPGGRPLLARVGPRRVPTRLFLAVPAFNGPATGFIWPVEGPIVSGFGKRRGGWHAGVDIKADIGTPILAAAPGVVTVSGWEASYGHVIKIEHTEGFITVYAHNLQNLVKAGEEVDAGTVIATVGRTGRATAYHVHFEIRREDMAYNPIHLLETPELTPMLAGAPALAGETSAAHENDGEP